MIRNIDILELDIKILLFVHIIVLINDVING